MINKILLLILLPIATIGQNTIGLPDIANYSKNDYVAGTQNWDIKQDKSGVVYFANNEGLLSFDGKYWKLYPLPNKTICRSIEIGKDNNIYTGGQDEMGYFSPDKNGILSYHTLVHLIPQKDHNFGDVWDIVSKNSDIYFRTSTKIFKFTESKLVNTFNAPSEWSFLGICNNNIYAHDYETGLLQLKNDVWTSIDAENIIPKNDPITGITSFNKSIIYISSLKNGLFQLNQNSIIKLKSPILAKIEKERIYSATIINKNWLALATNNSGVYIIDEKGEFIQHFSKKEGLQNNNTLSILSDHEGNIWLGLDNGIDYINYNSPIKHITPNDQNNSGYASIIYKNNLYLGTSGGLFCTALNGNNDYSFVKGAFNEVANADGQTWNLSEINGKLLLGHHEGAFIINDNTAKKISNTAGFWNFLPTTNISPSSKIVAGHYKGIQFFDFTNDIFTPSEIISDFNESSRYVTIDNNENIWVSHPYHGVFKINNKNNKYEIKTYTDKNGLPSLLNNQVFKINNRILIATEFGVFSYNENKDKFEPDELFKILGNQSIRYLKEDTDGNIWFIHDKQLGVIDNSDKSSKIIRLPELDNKMLSGFEMIFPVNANNIFLGGEKGFYHINYEKYKSLTPPVNLRISKVSIENIRDSVIFGGYFNKPNENQIQAKENSPSISYKWKNIHFEYAAAIFGNENHLEYSYFLEGFDKDWSAWSDKSEKDYTNLSPGNYTFKVKAKSNLNSQSNIVTYSFNISPPWYRSIGAYALYILITFVGCYNLYIRQKKKFLVQKKKFEEEQKRMSYIHQLDIDKAENELIRLRNEKLQSEIDYKNSELATNAMHLVQKGELLNKIKSELNHIMKGTDNEKTAAEIKKMIKVLSEDEKIDKDWDHFTQHFDKVNSDFVAILKLKHNNITANEMKLCTYLRMNLSTKEIAQLMNISVRGIEISRYRLRKKLSLATEVSLYDYLMGLNNPNS